MFSKNYLRRTIPQTLSAIALFMGIFFFTGAALAQSGGDDGPTAVALQVTGLSTQTVNGLLIFGAAFLLLGVATFAAYRQNKRHEERLKRARQCKTRK